MKRLIFIALALIIPIIIWWVESKIAKRKGEQFTGPSVIMLFGLMGYLDIPLDVTTMLLTSILVGVGVDYTVHFLWHLRDHVKDGDSLDAAITNTFLISGKGILFNGLSVVVGFSALLFSVFVPVQIFGTLVMGSISFCLFGALATLPALTSITKPKFLFK